MAQNKKLLILYLMALAVICFLFIFLLSVTFIGYSVKSQCQLAQQKYSGDCVETLNSWLIDESNSYESRNNVIWALGQLGDERSLPVLKSYYTGYNDERIARNEELSQYELQRAISYFEGNPNITTFFWRFGGDID